MYIGTASSLSLDLFKDGDVQYAVDYAITMGSLQMTMCGNQELKTEAATISQIEMLHKAVTQIVQRLKRYEKTEDTIALCGPLFMLYHVLVGLSEGGRYFDSGTKGVVQTGGVRKIQENGRISHADFREQVEHVLGVPETHCLDSHGMCEGNGLLVQCPKRHYLHTPYTYYKPLVLDGKLMPMG